MNRSIFILLLLILGLLLSACGPETGDVVVPIKFRHTLSPGSTFGLMQPSTAHASQNSPLALCLPRI